MNLRTKICFQLSKRLMPQPEHRTVNGNDYQRWRDESLSNSWRNFSDDNITAKTVLDFGCGTGEMALYLARKHPAKIIGVDVDPVVIEKAQAAKANRVEFVLTAPDKIQIDDKSVDTLLAFDCMEHVMRPQRMLEEWHRIVKPGGKCLIEWYPFKGAFGPHMEALIPIPWAHVLFGQRAMFRAAEAIYDLPSFVPRFWDLDEHGQKKPNKWRQWSTFKEQGYINELTLAEFKRITVAAGFQIRRFEVRSFGGSMLKKTIGNALVKLPLIGEYFVSHVLVELSRLNNHESRASVGMSVCAKTRAHISLNQRTDK